MLQDSVNDALKLHEENLQLRNQLDSLQKQSL
jgi:hypothetical protein